MVGMGLLLRLGSVAFQYRYHLNPALDHWRFGWEMGRVGRAIFEGRGFASPMYEPSGATAWMSPVYPLLIAASFKIFGLYSAGAAWFMLGLNSLFGALTALPVRAIARQLFGDAVALGAAWLWVFLPYSIYVAGERIWENTLTALLAACLISLTYALSRGGMRQWMLWGALWGSAALTSPALLSTLPALGLWAVWRAARSGHRWLEPALASAIIFLVILTPWTLRNFAQFHRLLPVRDNFWLEVHVGNNGDQRLPCPDAVHPSNSARERKQWAELGELAYMDAKKLEATQWLSNHPSEFLSLTVRRVLFIWTAFWSTSPGYLKAEPLEFLAVCYFTSITVLAAVGFCIAWRNGHRSMLLPVFLFLLLFPAPYYLTHPSYDYRHAMDPLLTIMVAYACFVDRTPGSGT